MLTYQVKHIEKISKLFQEKGEVLPEEEFLSLEDFITWILSSPGRRILYSKFWRSNWSRECYDIVKKKAKIFPIKYDGLILSAGFPDDLNLFADKDQIDFWISLKDYDYDLPFVKHMIEFCGFLNMPYVYDKLCDKYSNEVLNMSLTSYYNDTFKIGIKYGIHRDDPKLILRELMKRNMKEEGIYLCDKFKSNENIVYSGSIKSLIGYFPLKSLKKVYPVGCGVKGYKTRSAKLIQRTWKLSRK